jgi:hypothetical protein
MQASPPNQYIPHDFMQMHQLQQHARPNYQQGMAGFQQHVAQNMSGFQLVTQPMAGFQQVLQPIYSQSHQQQFAYRQPEQQQQQQQQQIFFQQQQVRKQEPNSIFEQQAMHEQQITFQQPMQQVMYRQQPIQMQENSKFLTYIHPQMVESKRAFQQQLMIW